VSAHARFDRAPPRCARGGRPHARPGHAGGRAPGEEAPRARRRGQETRPAARQGPQQQALANMGHEEAVVEGSRRAWSCRSAWWNGTRSGLPLRVVPTRRHVINERLHASPSTTPSARCSTAGASHPVRTTPGCRTVLRCTVGRLTILSLSWRAFAALVRSRHARCRVCT